MNDATIRTEYDLPTSISSTEPELIQFGVDFLQSLLVLDSQTATVGSPSTIVSLDDNDDDDDDDDQNDHIQPANNRSLKCLKHTREYLDLMQALRRLELIQRQPLRQQQQQSSFLQYDATDDILLRMFSYLQCRTLVHTMSTCTRWYHLTKRYATYRTTRQLPVVGHSKTPNSTRTMAIRYRRQLSSPLELLQAYENIIGIPPEPHQHSFITQKYNAKVPIPILLPSQPLIQVSDCGDAEYNGIYHCTGCNGNGYIFTKPRDYYQYRRQCHNRRRRPLTQPNMVPNPNHTDSNPISEYIDMADSDDMEMMGQPLRCIMARRFSNEVMIVEALYRCGILALTWHCFSCLGIGPLFRMMIPVRTHTTR